MSHKITLNPTGLPDGSSFTPSLNNNFSEIADEFDKVIYKDGSESMEGDLDMDSNRIYNLPAPVNNTEPLRLADVEALSGDIVINDNSTTIINEGGEYVPETQTFSNGPRIFATVFAEAELMAEDLTEMEGFAKHFGVTGGTGLTTYWVDNMSDDEGVSGSIRWAFAQAEASGGGKVLVSPRGEWVYFPLSSLFVPDNTTFDAPGRNLKIMNPGNIHVMDCRQKNWIIRRIKYERLGDQFDASQIRDTIFIAPRDTAGREADKFWVHEVTIERTGDGAIDCVSTAEPSTRCSGTISQVHFIDCDKTMSLGFSGCYQTQPEYNNPPLWCDTAIDQTPKFWITILKCHFDNCDQRQPRLSGLILADCVNNVHTMTPAKRDDGTFGGAAGSYVIGGGWLLSRGEFFQAGVGSGYTATDPETDPLTPAGGGAGATGGPGAVKNVGSVAIDGILINELNTDKVQNPPYTLTVEEVPAAGAARDAWIRAIEAGAGSEVDTAPVGEFIKLASLGSFYPDGQAVIKRDGSYYVRKNRDETKNAMVPSSGSSLLNFSRGVNLTLSADTLTLPDTGQYFSVLPESGTSDTLSTITGTGRFLIIKGSAGGNTVTVVETGNIILAGTSAALNSNSATLTLIYDTSAELWFEVSRSI